jgi:hypothetical protein
MWSIARPGPDLYRTSLFDSDLTDAGLEVAVAEASRAPKRRDACHDAHIRARRHGDRDVDRLATTAQGPLPPTLRGLDQQPAAVELHAGLLGCGDVGLLGTVARTDLDDRVGGVGGDNPEVTDSELDGYGNRCGGIESRHSCPPGYRAQPVYRWAPRAARGVR